MPAAIAGYLWLDRRRDERAAAWAAPALLPNMAPRPIWTAEDPVEITQKGLAKVEMNPKAGLTFAIAMRAFLRADPDVIMVGEMRDKETVSTGIEASLTGHLVFATLHTNSAPESVVRLLDMGMDPFNFADALLGVLAQRLARRLCKCKEPHVATADEVHSLMEEYSLDCTTPLSGRRISRRHARSCTRSRWKEFGNDKGEIGSPRRQVIPLVNDALLTLRHCPAPIIAVTGSAGKTTTTTLVGKMLEAAGFTVHVGGNIGTPLLDQLDAVHSGDKVVLELSSFQLELFDASPDIAVVLNITPNHLNRHPSMSHYAAAKANILQFQGSGDTCILNADDPYTGPWLVSGRVQIAEGAGQPAVYFPLPAQRLGFSLTTPVANGVLLSGDALVWRRAGLPDAIICPRSALQLRGRHNVANVLAAAAIAGAAWRRSGRHAGRRRHFRRRRAPAGARTPAQRRAVDQRLHRHRSRTHLGGHPVFRGAVGPTAGAGATRTCPGKCWRPSRDATVSRKYMTSSCSARLPGASPLC